MHEVKAMSEQNLRLKLLAIETATEACSAALYYDGEVTTRHTIAPRRHAELILTMVDELMTDSGLSLTMLDALAFGRGPGSFTGVRIATGVIQGLALATDLPVAPVSTLAALAQGALTKSSQVACAIDARMGEVYWALYKANENLAKLVGEEHVCQPDLVTVPSDGDWFGVGSGWQSYERKLQQAMGERLVASDAERYPTAAAICPLAADAYLHGNVVQVTEVLPVYLRDQVTG